ncbi:MAG: CBS domain-containing protein [Candidatus Heimdallarchaeota archaeon]|nr:MAG: CBS domain-containing protein [Candidatus Heimdallarchaeota archaeon]
MYATKVKDLMTKEIVSVSLNDSIEKVAQQMVDNQIGSILVHEDNTLFGIITKRDILEKVILTCQDPCEVKASDVATKKLITISSEETIRDVLILMHKHKVKRILVKYPDDDGLAGIITTYDLVAAFNSLELRSSP